MRVQNAAFALLGLLALPLAVTAEPYLAVQKGMQCSTCHTSPSGGGETHAVRQPVRTKRAACAHARHGEVLDR